MGHPRALGRLINHFLYHKICLVLWDCYRYYCRTIVLAEERPLSLALLTDPLDTDHLVISSLTTGVAPSNLLTRPGDERGVEVHREGEVRGDHQQEARVLGQGAAHPAETYFF